MVNLMRAHDELFKRSPDETFPTLDALVRRCEWQREQGEILWRPPQEIAAFPVGENRLMLAGRDDDTYELNDWSFSQLCRLAGVSKETVNRLSPATASNVFGETLPKGEKPLQLFTETGNLRSLHAASYTRLYNAELLDVVRECAGDFMPAQEGIEGGTGLYCGEQDMFCFLIDPTGWTEIGDQAFAPGFFLWNSEVGRRSIGIQTFWFQAVCQNHIVWDAVEMVEFTRKHTAGVRDGLDEIRRIIQELVAKRDARRDGFMKVIRQAMQVKLGDDAEAAAKTLAREGISRTLATKALEIAREEGAFTIFALVDALTRLTGKIEYAGDRTEADVKVASLLALAA